MKKCYENLIKKTLVRFLFVLVTTSFYGQEFELKGYIRDTSNNEVLESATVFVQTLTDSTVVAYSISNSKGFFEILGNTNFEKLRFLVSYNGYETYTSILNISNSKINIGEVFLKPRTFKLDETIVYGEGPPVVVKKDTLEFNANSFKTRPDAVLEDLLKELPGVEIDVDGKISINGKAVNNILINGKVFFNKDTKIAIKNIPVEIIDKIQVVDTKSENEKFTGERSSNTDKTINIKVKPEKNIGLFGRLSAGYGNDERYQLSGITNYFNEDSRISVLGGANNIDNPGFSYDDLSELSRNARNISWRGNKQGISTSNDLGVSLTLPIGKEKEISGEYFDSEVNVVNDKKVVREYFLPNQNYINNTSSSLNSNQLKRTADLSFKFKIDSVTQVSLTPSFEYVKNTDYFLSESESIDNADSILNNNTTESNIIGREGKFNNVIDLVRKLKSSGEYISFKFSNSNQDGSTENLFKTSLKENNEDESIVSDIQQNINEGKLKNDWGIGVKWRKKISKKVFINLNYDFNDSRSQSQRNVFDVSGNANAFVSKDLRLSSDLKSEFLVRKPYMGFSYEVKKVNIDASIGLLNSEIKNNELFQKLNVEQNFNDLFLDFFFSYTFKDREKLDFSFKTYNSAPSLEKFRPVPDETNPSDIVVGNIGLKREFRQFMSLSYNRYNTSKKSGINIYGDFNKFSDALAINRQTDQNLIRRTSYINTNGNYRGSFRASYNKTIKKEESSIRYQFALNSRFYRFVNVNNGVLFNTDRLNLYGLVRINYSLKNDFINIKANYSPRKIITKYSLDNFEDQNVFSHEVGLTATLNFPKNFIIENNVKYNYRPNIGDEFDKSNLFWNMSIGYKMLNDKVIIRLRAHDIFNQNISTFRSTFEDYIQDSESSVLQRYFLLSLTYKIDKLGNNSK